MVAAEPAPVVRDQWCAELLLALVGCPVDRDGNPNLQKYILFWYKAINLFRKKTKNLDDQLFFRTYSKLAVKNPRRRSNSMKQ